MAVKIKLKRLGKIRQPVYRIVVADSRTKRDGRAIEEIGIYRPKEEPSFIQIDSERVQYWLGVGAQPTEAVAAILRVTGDWQSFKGLPAPEPMKVAPARASKRELFAAAAKEAADEPKEGATTAKGTGAKAKSKAEAPAAQTPETTDSAEPVAADSPAAAQDLATAVDTAAATEGAASAETPAATDATEGDATEATEA